MMVAPVLCSLMMIGRKWTVSIWGFSCSSALCPYYCLVAYVLPSSIYSSGTGSSLSRDWLFWNPWEHCNAWCVTDASKLCSEAVSTHLTWWKIPLAHKGSDMKAMTEIRSETVYYRWLTGEKENQLSALQKRSHCKPSPPHFAIIFTSPVVTGQSLCITAHLGLTVLTESISSSGTSSWADMADTMSRSSFTGKECMLTIGDSSLSRYNRHQRRMQYCWEITY